MEILPFTTTRMNLEDMMLNETNQSQKDTCYQIPLYGASKVVRLIEAETGTWVLEICGTTETL